LALRVAQWCKQNYGTTSRNDDDHLLITFQVAVKVIRIQDGGVDEKVFCNGTMSTYVPTGCAIQELRRELGTWRRLHHVNILPLLGIARNFGPYISMVSPWLENGSLTVYLRKYKDITLSDRLRLVSFCMTR
jgi:serine/threonine protein kinase